MAEWQKGKVEWFDETSGEGLLVEESTGKSYYVHYSAIQNENRSKTLTTGNRRNLKEGATVKFKVYKNYYLEQVEAVREV